ncbi:MAG: NAD(P)/FAD-dependent oxidoreductase [Sarcina sp.]
MAKVVVIGGGPAGIMAALSSSVNNNVTLLERNDKIGKKLKLTGGGRCNITNNRDIEEFFGKVVCNSKFLYSAFYTFSNLSLLDYFDKKGLEYKVEYDQKVFTKSDKADEVIELFEKDLRENKVDVKYNTKVTDLIISESNIKGVILESGEKIFADKVIITTGGKSYPNTGSDGLMHNILEEKGHKINLVHPALIPLVIKEEFVKNLKGIAIKEAVVTAKIGKKKYQQQGDMLFTHFGVSGPAVLKISSYLNKSLVKGEEVELTFDFLPEVSKDDISKIIRSNLNKNVINNMKGLIAQNFLKEILDLLELSNVKANELKKEDENKIISYLKEMKITARDMLTITAAQVSSGGVSVKEINASTMESKIINGLYFAGEVIDVDAETGGYNLQIAFSTGYLAGLDY